MPALALDSGNLLVVRFRRGWEYSQNTAHHPVPALDIRKGQAMKELTDEQFNEEICKWRGWKWVAYTDFRGFPFADFMSPQMALHPTAYVGTTILTCGAHNFREPDGSETKGNWRTYAPPDHILGPEALGHMNEAEKGLGPIQRARYAEQLTHMIRDQETVAGFNDERFVLLHLTARKRAIALLRVVQPEIFE